MIGRRAAEGGRSDRTLDLWVRSFAVPGAQARQDAVVARLERLEARNVVAEFTVHVWGKRVPCDTATARTDACAAVLERIDAFRAWAERNDMSLGSFFDSEEVHSAITGETYETVTLPVMALAEYEGDDLRFVAPAADGRTLYTVTDRLDALERGETEVPHGGA